MLLLGICIVLAIVVMACAFEYFRNGCRMTFRQLCLVAIPSMLTAVVIIFWLGNRPWFEGRSWIAVLVAFPVFLGSQFLLECLWKEKKSDEE